MEIRWTPETASSLENISLRIAEGNPQAALKTVRIISQRIEHLATFPHRGRVGREEGSRELVSAPLPYIAVYRVKESIIEILQTWHGAQDRKHSQRCRRVDGDQPTSILCRLSRSCLSGRRYRYLYRSRTAMDNDQCAKNFDCRR